MFLIGVNELFAIDYDHNANVCGWGEGARAPYCRQHTTINPL